MTEYVTFKYVGHTENEYTPEHATEGASGADLRYAGEFPIVVLPRRAMKLSTGICVEIPKGYEGQLRLRSGFSAENLAVMLPQVGTIDSDYRGEISVNVFALADPIIVNPGDRIAQLIIAPYAKSKYIQVSELNETERGSGGFGSTGK